MPNTTVIILKNSATPGAVPQLTDVELGELAINTYDGKIYLKQDQSSTGGPVQIIPVQGGYTGSAATGYTGSIGYTGSLGYTGSSGTTGYTGSTGSLGYTGSQGNLGYTGSAGTTGYTGSRGADGTSITIVGTMPSIADSAAVDAMFGANNIGAAVIAEDTGYLWVKTGVGVWTNVGQIKGDRGYTGSQGTTGYTGSQGSLGYTGSSGTTGYTGSAGSLGYTGSTGYVGSKGQLNITLSSTAPADPNDGDIWIDNATGIQYFWITDSDSSQWVEDSNVGVRGPIGYTGSQGASGVGNNLKFSWSSPADANPNSGGTTTGTLAGTDASYSDATQGVKLTSGSPNSNGRIVWNLSTIDFTKDLSMKVSFYQDGADGFSLGLAGTNNFNNSQPATVANNSLSFWYKTYNNKTQFYINGSAVGSETSYLTDLGYENSWSSAELVLQTINSNRYAFLYHNNVLINSLDITSWTPTGSYIFTGAWSGDAGGNHYVNSVSIRYV